MIRHGRRKKKIAYEATLHLERLLLDDRVGLLQQLELLLR